LESARVNQGGFYQRCQVDVQIWWVISPK
jgi:hypothetical protein